MVTLGKIGRRAIDMSVEPQDIYSTNISIDYTRRSKDEEPLYLKVKIMYFSKHLNNLYVIILRFPLYKTLSLKFVPICLRIFGFWHRPTLKVHNTS